MARLQSHTTKKLTLVSWRLLIGLILIPLALFVRFVLIGYSTTAYLMLAVSASDKIGRAHV